MRGASAKPAAANLAVNADAASASASAGTSSASARPQRCTSSPSVSSVSVRLCLCWRLGVLVRSICGGDTDVSSPVGNRIWGGRVGVVVRLLLAAGLDALGAEVLGRSLARRSDSSSRMRLKADRRVRSDDGVAGDAGSCVCTGWGVTGWDALARVWRGVVVRLGGLCRDERVGVATGEGCWERVRRAGGEVGWGGGWRRDLLADCCEMSLLAGRDEAGV